MLHRCLLLYGFVKRHVPCMLTTVLIITLVAGMITYGLVFLCRVTISPRGWSKENVMPGLSRNAQHSAMFKKNINVTNAILTSNYKKYSNTPYLSKSNFLSNAWARSSLNFSLISNILHLNNIIVRKEQDCPHHKFIVYRCDYSRSCGGWGDRQRGIVSSFLLAILTRRAYVIKLDKPCYLENILKPHLYDWSVCKTFVNSIKNNNTKLFDFVDGSLFFRDIQNFDFDSKWRWQVVFLQISSNLIYHLRKRAEVEEQLDWLLGMTAEHIINVILQTLFQPAKSVLDYLNNFNENKVQGKSLVCSHIRKGRNPSIPTDNEFKEKPNETIIFNFLKNFTTSSKYALYLATDSISVRQEFARTFKNSINMNISIVHVDRISKGKMSRKQACEGFKFALIEQYILSACDILILTRSGFGRMAACMRGTSEHLYLLHPKTGRVVLTDLRHM